LNLKGSNWCHETAAKAILGCDNFPRESENGLGYQLVHHYSAVSRENRTSEPHRVAGQGAGAV